MKLQEEYLSRHKLTDVPLIYHTKNSSVILKLCVRPQVILNIRWGDPGNYQLHYLTPNHNSYLHGKYFSKFNAGHVLQYQDYTTFINRWAKHINFTPIDATQVRFAIIEMFMFCFDGWLCKSGMEDLIYSTIDPSLDDATKLRNVEEFEKEFKKEQFYEVYKTVFCKYADSYAGWLADLIRFYNHRGDYETEL
jgi:hypothetical protein